MEETNNNSPYNTDQHKSFFAFACDEFTRNTKPNGNLNFNQENIDYAYDDDDDDEIEAENGFLETDNLSDIETEPSAPLKEPHANNDDDDEALIEKSFLNEIYLSIIWNNNRLGLSYYDSNKEYLYYLKDIHETVKYEAISMLINDIQPCKIITNANTDESLIEYIRDKLGVDFEEKFQKQSSQDFNYELSKRRILEVKMQQAKELTNDERFLYYNSLLDFDSCTLMVRSIGALLKYLDRNRVNVELEQKTINTPIKRLKALSIDTILYINENSLQSLQIFHSIAHPSVYNINSNREGFSVYSLFASKLRTKYGHLKLRSWLLRPTRDLNTLKKRHFLVEFFLNVQYIDYKSAIGNCLKLFNKNINLIFKRMNYKQLIVNDWVFLYKTSVNFIKLLNLFNQIRIEQCIALVFEDFFSGDDDDYLNILNNILQLIMQIIDFKQMVDSKKICIQMGIDTELDEKREIYKKLPEYLTKIAYEQLDHLSVNECNIVYMPQVGFLLVFNLNNEMSAEDQAKFEFTNTIKFVFKDDGKYYYKNTLMEYLDNKYGDIVYDIRSRENKILTELQEALQPYAYIFNQLVDLFAEVDVCLAYALVAEEYNYVKPVISETKTESFIYAKQSRHPLIELCCTNAAFVPNDIYCGNVPDHLNNVTVNKQFEAKLKLMTGPNACGKTIYMKQVALLVYMCYIGSYVPAEYAFIGDIDRIHTRINSNTSTSLHMSTFFVDLQQICDALNSYTSKSLMIIDEFGKGTYSSDGPVLLAALIRYLIKTPQRLPHAFISTHYHEIFRQNLLSVNLNVNIDVEYLSFEYMKQISEANKRHVSIVYLYTLKHNSISNSSYAINVAQGVGLDESIINRAWVVYEAISSNENIDALYTDEINFKFYEAKEAIKEFLELCDADNTDGVIAERANVFRGFLGKLKEKFYNDEGRMDFTSYTCDTTTITNATITTTSKLDVVQGECDDGHVDDVRHISGNLVEVDEIKNGMSITSTYFQHDENNNEIIDATNEMENDKTKTTPILNYGTNTQHENDNDQIPQNSDKLKYFSFKVMD